MSFIPRAVFPTLDSLPRSYFLGHHRKGLSKMKTLLASTDLVIECRDYRVPLTSRNPLFEESLSSRARLLVYTKRDLGSDNTREDLKVTTLLKPRKKQQTNIPNSGKKSSKNGTTLPPSSSPHTKTPKT